MKLYRTRISSIVNTIQDLSLPIAKLPNRSSSLLEETNTQHRDQSIELAGVFLVSATISLAEWAVASVGLTLSLSISKNWMDHGSRSTRVWSNLITTTTTTLHFGDS